MNINIIMGIVLVLLIGVPLVGIFSIMVMTYNKIGKSNFSIQEIIHIKEDYNIRKDISVQDSRDLMEYLVNQALLEWQVYHIDPATDNYMSEEKINESMEYIIRKVMLEMTPTCRARLSVGYPMETEDQMIESIKNKAKIVVLNYTIRQNNNDVETNIPNINVF